MAEKNKSPVLYNRWFARYIKIESYNACSYGKAWAEASVQEATQAQDGSRSLAQR